MSFQVFIDPSEMKTDSRFMKCKGIDRLNPIPVPGLEEMTGADILIGPPNLPKPMNTFLLKMHLDQNALLVQLKFTFDLIASIIDGRIKHSQAKMLATGASPDQIILLFIGWMHEEDNKNLPGPTLMINGQKIENIVSAAKNLTYQSVLKQIRLYSVRGGVFEQITSSKNLVDWIESAAEVAFNEPESRQVWSPKQELLLINDWRNLLINLPGLGEKRANDIYDWLTDKSFYGFMAALENESLLNVPGIGSGTIEKIKNYLKGE